MKRYALFDFADTLAERSPSQFEVVSKYILNATNLLVPTSSIQRAYKRLDMFLQYSSVSVINSARREEFYIEYNRYLLGMLGLSHLTSPKELLSAFAENKAHWRLKHGVLDVLKQLRIDDWSIGVISNFDSILDKILYEQLGLAGIVDNLIVSQAEALEKPDPRFYQVFLSRFNVDRERSFYVGDSFYLDFLPAKKIGIKVFLLDEAGIYSYLPEAIGSIDHVIAKINADS